MPVHMNVSPILLRVLRILSMKIFGSSSLVFATCFSFFFMILLAVIELNVFSDSFRTQSVSLARGHEGFSRTLPTFDVSPNRTAKFRHASLSETGNEAEKLVGTEWSVQNYVDVFSSSPNCAVQPYLLILVTSAPENKKRRQAIRNTWARYRDRNILNETHFKTVFLIGRTFPALRTLLESESEKHKDILFGDYVDSYRNLTLKVQHGMMWAAESCQSRYLLKTDDDCFVNTRVMVEFLEKYNHQTTNLYAGHKLKSRDVLRDPHSKWYVSPSDYQKDLYPPYASGTGYLLSYDVVQRVVSRSPFHHPFPVEDAYMGVLAEDLGVPLLDTTRFALFSTKWTMCNYLYFFVVHDLDPEQQYLCLRYADESAKECRSSEELQKWV
ncbi:beta-1,3-galactosyltransferase 5-like [Diadema antillarum]|uniref:beta-1,3-galactosyltransferase 5-like n=1 Tax=Diadema antillarum TaxID=105358 RepID=UPI003A8B2B0B